MHYPTTIKNSLFVALAAVSLAACSHDFLDLTPEGAYTSANFWEDETQITQAVNAGYGTMRGLFTNEAWRLGEYRSDNTTFTENTADRGAAGSWDEDIFVSGASVGGAGATWGGCYGGISRMNIVLERIDAATFASEDVRELRRAEARFLRGMFYWLLVRNFGDVPILLKSEFEEEALLTYDRRPADEVYAQVIVPDVEFALAGLPVKWPALEIGRATKDASRMLLAHAYFTRRNFAAALPLLDSVIQSGRYSLLNNYKDVFAPNNGNNAEIIFSAQFDAPAGQPAGFFGGWLPLNSGTAVTGTFAVGTGTGFNRPTRELYKAYVPGDTRRDVSIGIYLRGRDTFLYPKKFIPDAPIPLSGVSTDWPIFRLADALLMRAEALIETGAQGGLPDQAFEDINNVRARAGLELVYPGNPDPSLDIQTPEALRQLLRNERRLELALESHRWYDLVRYGTVVETMQAHGVRLRQYQPYLANFPTAFQVIPELFPIPQDQVMTYGYPQNPGY